VGPDAPPASWEQGIVAKPAADTEGRGRHDDDRDLADLSEVAGWLLFRKLDVFDRTEQALHI